MNYIHLVKASKNCFALITHLLDTINTLIRARHSGH